MVFEGVNRLAVLCWALNLAAIVQIIVMGALSFGFSEFLMLTGCSYATGAGLVAGFVVLPITLRFKFSQHSTSMERIYGYTVCYQQMSIGIALTVHFIAAALALIAMIFTKNLGTDFYKLMKQYNYKHLPKSMIDNIQWALQCCGAESYHDWFAIDWEGSKNVQNRNSQKSIQEMLRDDDDNGSGRDDVPFSCCSRNQQAPCVHHNLKQLGTYTINTAGCGHKLFTTTLCILWFHFILFGLSIFLEISVLMMLKSASNSMNGGSQHVSKFFKDNATQHRNLWERFSNETTHTAEITPSSHSQIVLPFDEKDSNFQ